MEIRDHERMTPQKRFFFLIWEPKKSLFLKEELK